MDGALLAEAIQGRMARSLAQAMMVANTSARSFGIDVDQSQISITRQPLGEHSSWRINYGPAKYVGRRGGDLMIEVDSLTASVIRVLRGQ